MKSPKHAGKAAKKMPKARMATAVNLESVRWRLLADDEECLKMRSPHDTVPDYHPVLVLPMPTLSAAKKRLKFEKLSEEQKVEAIALAIYVSDGGNSVIPKWAQYVKEQRNIIVSTYRDRARSILTLISP